MKKVDLNAIGADRKKLVLGYCRGTGHESHVPESSHLCI